MSSPGPPFSVSSPAPPMMMSLPGPPDRESLPPQPKIVSSPLPATIVSSPAVPINRSAPSVWTVLGPSAHRLEPAETAVAFGAGTAREAVTMATPSTSRLTSRPPGNRSLRCLSELLIRVRLTLHPEDLVLVASRCGDRELHVEALDRMRRHPRVGQSLLQVDRAGVQVQLVQTRRRQGRVDLTGGRDHRARSVGVGRRRIDGELVAHVRPRREAEELELE